MIVSTKLRKFHCFLCVVGHRSSPKPEEFNKDLYKARCLETGTVALMYGREVAKQRLERDVSYALTAVDQANMLASTLNVRKVTFIPAPWYVWVHYGLMWVAMKLLLGKASRDFVWEIVL